MSTNPSPDPAHCPLLGTAGMGLRQRTGEDLLALYQHWLGAAPPSEFHPKWFANTIVEYESKESGLRWYSPRVMADGAFYAWLGREFPWYYKPETWDKTKALAYLRAARVKSFVEVGCGNGSFIRMAALEGIDGAGIDLRAEVVAKARAEGLQVFTLDDTTSIKAPVEALCLFQTLEHLNAPAKEMRVWVERFRPRLLIVSVPCWDSYLGISTDPLSWPPHHATAWSGRALEVLGSQLGACSTEVFYQPLSLDDFCCAFARETVDNLDGVPLRIANPSKTRIRWLRTKWWMGRLLRRPWAMRGHSVMAAMKFDRT